MMEDGKDLWLCAIELVAPSLEDWFQQWLNPKQQRIITDWGELSAESVDVAGLDNPDIVWRGLHRFEPYSPDVPEPSTGDELPWWHEPY